MRVFALIVLLSVSGLCQAEAYPLSSELWAGPRSGETIRANPALRRAADAYLSRANARMRLHHSKRDEALAQAEEVRGWLIALGVEAGRIELIEDSPTDVMTLEVVDTQ